MRKDIAKTRIMKKINRLYANETIGVREYLIEIVLLTWQNLEMDYGACHDDGRPYTSSENLEYAIDTIDNLVLEEARRETQK